MALVSAAHPIPCAAVTAFCVATALTAGLGAARTILLGAAVLAGQLSVGWCNDYLDGARDRAAGRTDKPVAAGEISRRVVGIGAAVAVAACIPLSLALGVRPGLVHLLAVASAWCYDLGIKSTIASPLPYLVSFSLVPPVLVARSLPGAPLPRWPVVAAAGLLGVAAHFANTVPDTAADAATGVRGLPQRIGPRRSVLVSSFLLAVVAGLLVPVILGSLVAVTAVPAAGGLALLNAATVLRRGGMDGPVAFRITMVAAAVVVVAFVASGSSLVGG